ncbi:sigma-54-dependent Fis family transcriptional regulator [Ectothiorhodospiraceae bacterium BW-2]|nr:sigma-54-dependent Fis family transcriptional regulator [Ectothiorhodospiraceae bacterium BW-2]
MSREILIVDDEPNAVTNLAHLCRKEGYRVTTTTSGAEAKQLIQQQRFDLILTDLHIDHTDGMTLLELSGRYQPDSAVIMITGFATLESAVAAMKAGAFHYIAKPFHLNEVRQIIRNALNVVDLKQENQQLKQQLEKRHTIPLIITQDSTMEQLLQMARQLATATTSVLISGESGTGKELLARYIHAHSGRHRRPFMAINCGALQEELLANELFGHEKGAFTGAAQRKTGLIEAANGSTLLLDEIGEMSLSMQVKLLRVLQEHEIQPLGSTSVTPVDVRILSATHRNMSHRVANGEFRQDLYYRLNVVELTLPPLRQRQGDIPLLALHFLRKHTRRMERNIDTIAPEVLDYLTHYPFPGNIRELENIIERAVALARGREICFTELPPHLQPEVQNSPHLRRSPLPPLTTLAEREAQYITEVLQRVGHNRTQAAKILGIDRVSLWRKMRRYQLDNGHDDPSSTQH